MKKINRRTVFLADTRKITVSAPGKLMLLGEHSVVYGRPCLVTAVDQRIQATVELTDLPTGRQGKPFFELNAPDVGVIGYKKPMSELGIGEIPKGAKIVEVAIKNFINGIQGLTDIKVTTKSQFSSEFGFGSSSASTVCVIKALSELTGKKLSNQQIFDLSYKTVLDIQGKGSGFDVAAATFGGTLYYITPGKNIQPLKINHLPLIVGYSGIKFDTVRLIDEVAKKAQKYPQIINNVYDQIGKLVELAKKAILTSDWQRLGELMNLNEGYLSILGVEGRKLSSMIYAAREAGAYGAKLSGAGMGDCMIALAAPNKLAAVKKAITQAGGQMIDVKENVEGVRIES